MKIFGVEIRKVETKEQWDWFNNFKHELARVGFLSDNAIEVDSRSSSTVARLVSSYGWELIEADGKIWAIKPQDNFKEIFGLNPVKSGTTHQHQAQVARLNESYPGDLASYIKTGRELLADSKAGKNPFEGFTPSEEGEGSNKVPEHDTEPPYGSLRAYCLAVLRQENIRNKKAMGDISFAASSDKEEEGEMFNKTFNPYDEGGDGGVFCTGETSGSTKNMNYGCGEVRGHPDHNHIRKNRFASDDEGLTEAMQKSINEARQKSFEAVLKRNIDNRKANDQHVLDIPESPDRSNKKEQANDGLYKLCEMGLSNTVSLMGSNPPPWAATPASQGLSGFSWAANAVGYVGSTAALSLRYTKPRAARIFANVGPLGCAWGVIMGLTSYFPEEFQWLGYVAAVFCTLMVLLANY